MRDPRINPCLVGRGVEETVSGARAALLANLWTGLTHGRVDERQGHQPDRTRRRLGALGGDEVLGQTVPEHALVLARKVGGVDVVPPGDLLPFAHPPRVTTGLEDLHLANEVLDLVRR